MTALAPTRGTPLPGGIAVLTSDFYRTAVGLQPRQPKPLTGREIQVLSLVAEGHTNDEIGQQLSISAETVKTMLLRARRKLGAKDRAHAVAKAFQAGVLR